MQSSLFLPRWFLTHLPLAHHELYEKAGILHRDISLDNLMVDANDHKRGVLIDLDIAAHVRDEDTILTPNLTYAGTLSFRSIDLLKTNTHFPARTVYRDDLESFLYVLVYILTFYEMGVRRPLHDELRWREIPPEGDMRSIGYSKHAFLHYFGNEGLPDGPLSASWLQPLRQMFAAGHDARSKARFRTSLKTPIVWTDAQEETLGGVVTFETFMDIISRT